MVAIAALAAVPTVMVANSAYAATSIIVNSTAFGGADASPGNGVCETAAGNGICTLRAAIEESNAINGAPGDVIITVADGVSGNIVPDGTNTAAASNRPNWMYPTATGSPTVSSLDTGGAFYRITAPVTIDLDNRLSINDGAYDTSQGAAFFIDGPNVTILNASQIFGSGSSFVMGSKANNVVIDGGSTRTTASNVADRFLTFTSGSQNIMLRNYTVSGFNHYATGSSANASRSGLLWFDSKASSTFTNYTIDNVLFDYPTSGSCSATDGTGCATSLIDFRFRNVVSNSIQVTGFTFKNSTVQNMPGNKGVFGFPFGDGETVGTNTGITNYGVTLTNLSITDNRFLNNKRYNAGAAGNDPTKYGAFIVLPYRYMNGNNVIARNEFVRAQPGVVNAANTSGLNPYAIYLQGDEGANSTAKANLAITDNYFDGYAGQSTIRMYQAGRVTVARNTFGPNSSSTARGTNLASGEETGTGTVMYANATNESNRKINTWYPTAAATVPSTGAQCMAEVSLKAITGTASATPQAPVRVDLYWTKDRTAEVYLGTYEYATLADQKITVDLPMPGDERLKWVADQTGANVPVDPETGAVNGFFRVQTHSGKVGGTADGELESSQYSRVAPLTGTCAPALTIDQAVGQNESTMARDLHFTITSTLPLDEASLTADKIVLSAVPTPGVTIDDRRINAQVISITPVGTDGKTFDVVVHVDDSATVTATLPAGAVTTLVGIPNPAAATSKDNTITFVNPLQVNPPQFTLVTGEPRGKSYVLSVKPGAPVPAATLQFSSTVQAPPEAPDLSLSTMAPSIAANSTQSDPITVTAAEGDVGANTKTTIAHKVISEDSNFDGLVVPYVYPYLFSTDPTIKIEKRAWVANPDNPSSFDMSAPDTIEQTGVPAPKDTRLTDRQTVCFVYTVYNTSQDEWATSLRNVQVTDSDERLGTGGVIGEVAALAQDTSTKLSACTAMLPVDTTASDDAPVDEE